MVVDHYSEFASNSYEVNEWYNLRATECQFDKAFEDLEASCLKLDETVTEVYRAAV